MTKQIQRTMILFVSTFIIGSLGGYLLSESSSNKEPVIETVDIPKKELNIDPDFLEVDPLVYDDSHLKTKVQLNDKGSIYNATELFSTQYTIKISLVNNQFENPYLTLDDINWNIEDILDIDADLDLNKITDKEMQKDFNKQLEAMKKGEEHEITYRIEVYSKVDGNRIAGYLGGLYEK